VYSYDYASSTFTAAVLLNKKAWVSPGEAQQGMAGLLETLDDSILFGHSIDLVCQVVIELLSRYLRNDNDDDNPAALRSSPSLPALPPVSLSIKANERLFFGATDVGDPDDDEQGEADGGDDPPWMIYIYVLLCWMVVTGVGVRCKQHTANDSSIWERIVGQVAEHKSTNMDKITRTFWSLLMAFLTRLLQALPETTRYQLIDRHLLDTNNPWADDDDDDGDSWDDYLLRLLGPSPVLPEDDYLRGLGWLDDLFASTATPSNTFPVDAMAQQRRIKILDFGFTLVKVKSTFFHWHDLTLFFISDSKCIKCSNTTRYKNCLWSRPWMTMNKMDL
jgi:hypothetical protein